jgi:uncharacterized membrane protein YraQ (UPF0718 family)
MNSLQQAGYWFLYIAIELSVLFLVITFIIGVITTYLSPEKIQAILQKYGKGLLGNLYGTVLGGLLPFCSCSTIPMLIGLLKVGVPFRIAMSFLIASPLGVLNLVVIGLFATVFSWKVALAYVFATAIAAILAGLILNWAGLSNQVRKVVITGGAADDPPALAVEGTTLWEKLRPRLSQSWKFAWQLYKQMIPFLIGGVAIGAFIYGFVPEDFFVRFAGQSNPFAVPIAAAIGVPMYVRTETLIPIASAMVDKGVAIGTVMALIIGGAGASIPELSLLAKIFKRKLWGVYILTIFLSAVLIGFLFNFMAGQGWL